MGEGNDTLVGGERNDVIQGGEGNDTLVGDLQDTVASAANDVIELSIEGENIELNTQQKAFQDWLNQNRPYVQKHDIEKHVKVLEDRVEFTDSNGIFSIPFGLIIEQRFTDLTTNRTDYGEYTREKIMRILKILGVKIGGKYEHTIHTKEVPQFLNTVLGWGYNIPIWTIFRQNKTSSDIWAIRLSLDTIHIEKVYIGFPYSAIAPRSL